MWPDVRPVAAVCGAPALNRVLPTQVFGGYPAAPVVPDCEMFASVAQGAGDGHHQALEQAVAPTDSLSPFQWCAAHEGLLGVELFQIREHANDFCQYRAVV